MSYAFDPNISLRETVQQIAMEQLDEGLARIKAVESGPVEAVHDLRKRCKKMRALLRLVYPGRSDEVRMEKEWYRDTSVLLSDVRDAQITIEVFDQIVGSVAYPDTMPIFRDFLVSRCRVVEKREGGIDGRLKKTKERFVSGRERVLKWQLDAVCSVFLQEGFFKAYRRVVKAMRRARADPTTENYHEWRKSAKNHWYHTRLLKPLWLEEMTPYKETVFRLTDHLGNERDLFTLSEALYEMTPQEDDRNASVWVQEQIKEKRAELRAKSIPIGEAISVWNPVPLLERVHVYWGAEIDVIS
ncbi:MAG: CHAD domain-containing protein [Rhodothermia bacterium]|nr:MAG: CHAD domain-containing protein [Rhodothermia bacterium]